MGVRYATDIDYERHLLYVNFREDNENGARAKNAEYRKAKISDATFEILQFYIEEYKDLIFQQEYLIINISGDYAGKPMQQGSSLVSGKICCCYPAVCFYVSRQLFI